MSDVAESNAICLDQFLKWQGIADTGGQAKVLIQDGDVRVNGAVETRRRRKLSAGDVIEIQDQRWIVPSLTP